MVFTCLLCVSSSQWDVSPKESTITLVFNTDKSRRLVVKFISLLQKKEVKAQKILVKKFLGSNVGRDGSII